MNKTICTSTSVCDWQLLTKNIFSLESGGVLEDLESGPSLDGNLSEVRPPASGTNEEQLLDLSPESDYTTNYTHAFTAANPG